MLEAEWMLVSRLCAASSSSSASDIAISEAHALLAQHRARVAASIATPSSTTATATPSATASPPLATLYPGGQGGFKPFTAAASSSLSDSLSLASPLTVPTFRPQTSLLSPGAVGNLSRSPLLPALSTDPLSALTAMAASLRTPAPAAAMTSTGVLSLPPNSAASAARPGALLPENPDQGTPSTGGMCCMSIFGIACESYADIHC
jgi:hypothetical protein